MSKITKIEPQVKNKDRVNIYLDGEFKLGCSLELAMLNHLKNDVEISDEQLEQLVFENENEWPEQIKVDSSDQILNNQDIKRIRDYFLTTESPFKACDWALEALEKDYYKNNKIVNYKSSRTIKTDKEKL